jgi:mRNA interferase MazF
MVRKTFVISKQVIVKKYGTLSAEAFRRLHRAFCGYFGCE